MYRLTFDIFPDTGESRTSLFGPEVEENREKFDLLHRVYDIAAIRTTHPNHVSPLKPKPERMCRFCGRKADEVKFKKRAHLMSELLGNKVLFSDFECDECNGKFSKYEDQLANYLGIFRSVNGTRGKDGPIKYKSPDESFVIMHGKLPVPGEPDGLIIESRGEDKNHFTFDTEGRLMTVHAPQHSYRPYQVYKALLKMALGLIKEKEVEDYLFLLDQLINTEEQGDQTSPFNKVLITRHPGPGYPSPTMLLFKKKAEIAEAFPTHIFCLLYDHYMFQIFVPCNKKDQWMYDGMQNINLPYVPPFLDKYFVKQFGKPKGRVMDCRSNEKVKGSIQDFSFSFGGYEDTIFDEEGNVKEVRKG
ncbi:MAG: hypothetical protein JWP78_2046 [Mucilaginibacter sp.]|nr:hypothetical protein [Mucilaginibacter sp.]